MRKKAVLILLFTFVLLFFSFNSVSAALTIVDAGPYPSSYIKQYEPVIFSVEVSEFGAETIVGIDCYNSGNFLNSTQPASKYITLYVLYPQCTYSEMGLHQVPIRVTRGSVFLETTVEITILKQKVSIEVNPAVGEVPLSVDVAINLSNPIRTEFWYDIYCGGTTGEVEIWTSNTSIIASDLCLYEEPGDYNIDVGIWSKNPGDTSWGQEGWNDVDIRANTQTAPTLVVDPYTWDFGDVGVGTSVTKTFEIFNRGGRYLSGSPQNLAASFFSCSGDCQYNASLYDEDRINITFSPEENIDYNNLIELTCSSGCTNSIVYLPVAGVGVLSGTDRDCIGSWVFDSCDASCGGGTKDAVFRVTQQKLGGGVSCSNVDGDVASEDCNTQACAGSPRLIVLGSADFGDVNINTSDTKSFSIKNTGDVALTGAIGGISPPFFCNEDCLYSLDPGQTKTIIIQYLPTEIASHNETISFSCGPECVGGSSSVFLSGSGVGAEETSSPEDSNNEPGFFRKIANWFKWLFFGE